MLDARRYRIATQVVLVASSLFWLPWGLINLINPESWSGEVIAGIDVYDLSEATARTEVRAMYGGLQMAIGAFALVGAFSARHRRSVLLFFTLALAGLTLCRLGGLVVEDAGSYLRFATDFPPSDYNQVGLAMYELPNLVLVLLLKLAGWRLRRSEGQALDGAITSSP